MQILQKGDKIGIIAPSGPIDDVKKLEAVAKTTFKDFEVKIFPSCYDKRSDQDRLYDLHSAFSDDDISAIICARGGYGTLRIVDNIDYKLLSRHPKVFAGSSDITLLLMSIYKNTNNPKMLLFHAPMALNGYDEGILEDFLNTVNGHKKELFPRKNYKSLMAGEVQGIFWGGNLATVVSAFGSNPKSYVPVEDIVLFLEDLNEPVYKIDKMLRQIYRNKNLKVKGLVFGDFLDTTEGLEEKLLEYARLFDVPAGYGYPITHLKPNATVPFGVSVKFESGNGKISF